MPSISTEAGSGVSDAVTLEMKAVTSSGLPSLLFGLLPTNSSTADVPVRVNGSVVYWVHPDAVGSTEVAPPSTGSAYQSHSAESHLEIASTNLPSVLHPCRTPPGGAGEAGRDDCIVIATRPKDAPAGAMASLILEVPNLDKAIESAKAAGGTLMRPPAKSGEGLNYAFAKDPDGNQIELVMSPK
jgi:catechol 2,3-dioxygenase-like lactoylglutathione lyase family enzyme